MVKGKSAEGIALIRQVVPGALQNMQRTVTVFVERYQRFDGLTEDEKTYADHERVYGEK